MSSEIPECTRGDAPVRPAGYELTAKDAARLQMISCEDVCMAVTAQVLLAPPNGAGHELQAHVAADIDAPRTVKTFCKALPH